MATSGSITSAPASSYYYNRTITLSWSVASQSISNNTTTINWTLKGSGGATNNWVTSGNFNVIIDGVQRYFSATRINVWNGTVIASGSCTLGHDSAGNKSFSAYIEAGIGYVAVSQSASGSWSLPNIPRAASITAAPNFNDTQNPTISYSNPAGNAVSELKACISLTGSAADVPYRDIPKTGTSYTFNLTNAERDTLRAATANSKSRTVYFYIATTIGGTVYRKNVAKTFTVINANPTFSAAYRDTNSTVTAITGNNQLIVRNQSTLQINVTNLSAKKSATISSVKCEINGTTYNGTISGTSCTFNIGKLNVSSNVTATVTVTDSRGYTASTNLTIQVLDWSLPSAIITMQRHNNFYSNTDINVDGSISSVNSLNVMTIKMRYKKVINGTWSSYVTMQDNVTQTFNLDNNYEWDVQVVISDKFGTTTYNLVLSRGMPIIYFDRIKSSVGFNCFPVGNRTTEGVTKDVMTRSLSAQITNLAVGTYTIIPLNLQNSCGARLTTTNDGGIKIGAGISKVLVSGKMAVEGVTVAGSRHLRICKNSYSAANTLGWAWDTLAVSDAEDIIITPQVVDVEEDDVIYLYYWTQQSSDKIGGNAYGGRTCLTVEVVG